MGKKGKGKAFTDKINGQLVDVDATGDCPRCGDDRFGTMDDYLTHTLEGGGVITTAISVCSQCGWLAQHVIEPFGPLPKV